MRVAIFAFDADDQGFELFLKMRSRIEDSGHSAFFADKSLTALGMDVGRISKFVRGTEADAWVVPAASKEVLSWFAEEKIPTFAIAGRRFGLPIAGTGPDKAKAEADATRHLIGLGHRRISYLCRRQHRLPKPGRTMRACLDELEAAGIRTGEFNLPDWDESSDGFGRVLDALFQHTPPTALVLDEPMLYHAAYHHLARRGLKVPDDVSLVCADWDPGLAWCRPTVAHVDWDYRPVVNRVVRWANNVSRGRDDRRQSFSKATFVEGGSVGPAKK